MNVRHPITGCAYQTLTGYWAVEPQAFALLVEQARSYDLRDLAKLNAEAEARDRAEDAARPTDQSPPSPYEVHADTGRAVIHVTGPTTRHPTSFSRVLGGTSTAQVERALNAAVADDRVKGIMMRYESPGGTLAGSAELVDRLRWAGERKPIVSHIDDIGCSAAMLYAIQGRRVTANRTANVGSIGVLGQPLVDSSAAAALQGIVVHPIASPTGKAANTAGVAVSAVDVANERRRVDSLADDFIAEVASRRRLTPAFVRSLNAGVFTAREGLERNLIDGVCSFEQALADAAA